ncbi:MAG: hypothetical protein VXY93_18125, partial [Pseudomonadota bacterium]|nr:hypothetical protein [Pseudomonadota bacterium]
SQVITGRWRSDSLQLLNGTALTVSGNATIGETLNISGDNPNITFADTNSNPDFQIYASNGAFTIRDSTNATNRFSINSVGNATFAGDLDVDGHTNLDNVSIAGVVTATTFVGALTGNVTGNADSATTAANLSFGSANQVVFKNSSNNGATSSNLTFNGSVLTASGGGFAVTGSQNTYLNNNILSFDRAGYSYIDQSNDSGQLVFRVTSSYT